MTGLRIRDYTSADHDAVWALHNLALESTGARRGNGPWDDDLHAIEQVYLAPGGAFLVGECAGQLVAMGALKPSSADRAELKRMRVHPEQQRRGHGQALLRALERRAIELGLTRLHLDTTTLQVPAQQLYLRNGYTETGRGTLGRFEIIFYEKALA